MKEEWKDIKGYEGLYQVSNKGRVKSVERKVWHSGNQSYKTIKERILKPKNNNGYVQVKLYKDGNSKLYYIHRLVANSFIPNPDNKPEVNHIDENKTNNCVSNLEWVTSKENINHGTRNERMAKTQTNRKDCSKPIIGISKDGKSYLYFNSINDAQRLGGFDDSSISKCCRGKYKQHKGYSWMYAEE